MLPDDTHPGLDEALILVVGARRSGTHWLQRILATHPDVTALPGETHFFSSAIAPLMERFLHATPASPTLGHLYVEPAELTSAARAFCDAVLLPHLKRSGTARLLERTPEHVQVIELIARLYPATRFVHIIRDGRDAVRSLLHQNFGPSDVRSAAVEWRDAVRAGREQGQRVRHYREIRYESLLDDTSQEIAALLEWLELAADDTVLDAAVSEAQVVRNRPRGRPRQLRRLPRIIRQAAGDLLDELGYGDTTERPADAVAATTTADNQRTPARVDTPHTRQLLFDQFLSELRQPSPNMTILRQLASAGTRYEVVSPGGEVSNPPGLDELVADLAGDEAFHAEPSRARLHFGSDLTVLVHETGSGVARIVAARFDEQGLTKWSIQRVGD